jgi:CheY-like chemotaxis protein
MAQTILVIDDDPDIRTVAQVALTGFGYVALETGDPQRAL